MNINDQEFEFMPPLVIPGGACAEVKIEMPSGRAHVEIRCMVTHHLMEHRCDCQVIDADGKKIIVAAPESS